MGGIGTYFGWVWSHGGPIYLSNATTTYVGKFGGLLPGAYTIFMTVPRAPLTNHAWTCKLQDSITHWPIHSKTFFLVGRHLVGVLLNH